MNIRPCIGHCIEEYDETNENKQACDMQSTHLPLSTAIHSLPLLLIFNPHDDILFYSLTYIRSHG